jgi:hypothetical protein
MGSQVRDGGPGADGWHLTMGSQVTCLRSSALRCPLLQVRPQARRRLWPVPPPDTAGHSAPSTQGRHHRRPVLCGGVCQVRALPWAPAHQAPRSPCCMTRLPPPPAPRASPSHFLAHFRGAMQGTGVRASARGGREQAHLMGAMQGRGVAGRAPGGKERMSRRPMHPGCPCRAGRATECPW